MTKKQKRFLEKTFKCLDINAEDLMKITKIKELEAKNEVLEARLQFVEQALKISNEAIVKLNGNLTELSAKIIKMQSEEIMEGNIYE